MRDIGRHNVPLRVIVHLPSSSAGRQELARRMADVHADMVHGCLQQLSCPSQQKQALLDALLQCAQKQAGEQSF